MPNPNQYGCARDQSAVIKGFHTNLQISPNGETAIKQSEVKQALDLAGYRLPNHRVRQILAELKKGGKISGDEISKEVFKEICRKEKLADNTQDWKTENRLSIVSLFALFANGVLYFNLVFALKLIPQTICRQSRRRQSTVTVSMW